MCSRKVLTENILFIWRLSSNNCELYEQAQNNSNICRKRVAVDKDCPELSVKL